MASARPESASCYTAYLAIRRCAGIEARVFTRVLVKPQANRVLGGDDSLCYTTVNAVGFSGTSRTDSRDLFHLHEPTSDAIPCHMTGTQPAVYFLHYWGTDPTETLERDAMDVGRERS